jgi:hypothetical protein
VVAGEVRSPAVVVVEGNHIVSVDSDSGLDASVEPSLRGSDPTVKAAEDGLRSRTQRARSVIEEVSEIPETAPDQGLSAKTCAPRD